MFVTDSLQDYSPNVGMTTGIRKTLTSFRSGIAIGVLPNDADNPAQRMPGFAALERKSLIRAGKLGIFNVAMRSRYFGESWGN